MAVTDDGTIYIAYARDNSSNKTDIFVATSPDGRSFMLRRRRRISGL